MPGDGLYFTICMKWSQTERPKPVVTLNSDPMDCGLPGSSVHGIFRARIGWRQCLKHHLPLSCQNKGKCEYFNFRTGQLANWPGAHAETRTFRANDQGVSFQRREAVRYLTGVNWALRATVENNMKKIKTKIELPPLFVQNSCHQYTEEKAWSENWVSTLIFIAVPT